MGICRQLRAAEGEICSHLLGRRLCTVRTGGGFCGNKLAISALGVDARQRWCVGSLWGQRDSDRMFVFAQ